MLKIRGQCALRCPGPVTGRMTGKTGWSWVLMHVSDSHSVDGIRQFFPCAGLWQDGGVRAADADVHHEPAQDDGEGRGERALRRHHGPHPRAGPAGPQSFLVCILYRLHVEISAPPAIWCRLSYHCRWRCRSTLHVAPLSLVEIQFLLKFCWLPTLGSRTHFLVSTAASFFRRPLLAFPPCIQRYYSLSADRGGGDQDGAVHRIPIRLHCWRQESVQTSCHRLSAVRSYVGCMSVQPA